jgi:hypothetical protein
MGFYTPFDSFLLSKSEDTARSHRDVPSWPHMGRIPSLKRASLYPTGRRHPFQIKGANAGLPIKNFTSYPVKFFSVPS